MPSETFAIPVISEFSDVADPHLYVPIPSDWCICVADVEQSTAAIKSGRYKAVNMAGAGIISAASNALMGDLELFVFSGDGAKLVVPPKHAETVAEAVSRAAAWSLRDLKLNMRVGMISVGEMRAHGFDVRVAQWQASENVKYAMFVGGGLEHAEKLLKSGQISSETRTVDASPNLKGLSCQWGPLTPTQGKVVSLIVRSTSDATDERYIKSVREIVEFVDTETALNPVSESGPKVTWPSNANRLQAYATGKGSNYFLKRISIYCSTVFQWAVFKSGIRIGSFDPKRYRREISQNSDYRKFDDALMMTVDCSETVAESLRNLLEKASKSGILRYGMHLQDQALMTCVVPSIHHSDHIHFVDGAGGGYAAAAEQLR